MTTSTPAGVNTKKTPPWVPCSVRNRPGKETSLWPPKPSDAGRPQSFALPGRGLFSLRPGDRGPVPDPQRSAGSTGRRRGRGSLPSQTGGEKSSPWVPPASPRLAGFLSGFISVKPLDCVSLEESEQPKVQLLTVDHSARGSMKTAANCVS